jgi:hypothetical protein
MLRHLLATLAYRAAKVLRDTPPGFSTFTASADTRQPVRIVAHLADLMTWGVSLCDGRSTWKPVGGDDWGTEVQRFFDGMRALDARLAAAPPSEDDSRRLIAGPLADALTHVGQLAMLRGMAGAPVRPESYARAAIVEGRVGPDQAAPGQEFDGDASARR